MTEKLLTAWSSDPPSGRWLLWGTDLVKPYMWPASVHIPGEPSSLPVLDQVRLRRLPRHDVALFMLPVHPVPRYPYVTVIHDTIPLRWGGSSPVRAAKGAYLRLLARRATAIITVSDYSRAAIVADLGVPAEKISVHPPAEDRAWVTRVRRLREVSPVERFALYVGRFAPHKNLDRLVRVFAATGFARGGGRLRLVGGDPGPVAMLRRRIEQAGAAGFIAADGVCSEDELERLYASAAFLIVPSYEEGHGLPAREALSIGLPVCCSTGGALSEIEHLVASSFDPRDDRAMRAAIDLAAASSPSAVRRPGSPLGAYGKLVADVLQSAASAPRPL